jgi:hypothetical protein
VVPRRGRRAQPDCRPWQYAFVRSSTCIVTWKCTVRLGVANGRRRRKLVAGWSGFQDESVVPSRAGDSDGKSRATVHGRKCVARLAAVSECIRRSSTAVMRSSRWPPRRADHCTAAAKKFVDSDGRSDSIHLERGGVAAGRVGTGRTSRASAWGSWCWKASCRLLSVLDVHRSSPVDGPSDIIAAGIGRREIAVPVALVLEGVVPVELKASCRQRVIPSALLASSTGIAGARSAVR